MEAPWANPLQQLDYGDFLYSVGILDQHDRDNVQVMMELEKQLIRDRRYAEAFMVRINATIFNFVSYKNVNLFQFGFVGMD